MKKYYCKDCKMEISRQGLRCRFCANKGKNNPMFGKHPNHKGRLNPMYGNHYFGENSAHWKGGLPKCIDCGKQLGGYRSKRCKSCARTGKLNPWYGKKYPNKIAQKRSAQPLKHHIYLKENSNKTIKLSYSKHCLLHQKVYQYLYDIQGKKGINKYLKWFDKKYKLGN